MAGVAVAQKVDKVVERCVGVDRQMWKVWMDVDLEKMFFEEEEIGVPVGRLFVVCVLELMMLFVQDVEVK